MDARDDREPRQYWIYQTSEGMLTISDETVNAAVRIEGPFTLTEAQEWLEEHVNDE